jgi:hypothetical protein
VVTNWDVLRNRINPAYQVIIEGRCIIGIHHGDGSVLLGGQQREVVAVIKRIEMGTLGGVQLALEVRLFIATITHPETQFLVTSVSRTFTSTRNKEGGIRTGAQQLPQAEARRI